MLLFCKIKLIIMNKKTLTLIIASAFSTISLNAQFSNTPTTWNVPTGFEDASSSGRANDQDHSTFDINGDGLPDLIDGIETSGNFRVWGYGTSQYYWKVYLNNGTGFNTTPTTWNVPTGFEDALNSGRAYGQDHTTLDINGDGLPDLIDGITTATGNSAVWGYGTSQYYWKVYLNNGTGFNSTPTTWNVPTGFEDAGSSGTANGDDHSTFDINGDGLPDLIDGISTATGNSAVWGYGTAQYYWKVYLNNGTGFNSTATTWNVPTGFEDAASSGRAYDQDHTTLDINGDGLPDLIDGIDVSSGNFRVWGIGTSQYYWKIYLNNGTGFSSTATIWNVPTGFENALNSGRANGQDHSTLDMNGDGFPDLIDGIDASSGSFRVWGFGTSQYYWKVYLSELTPSGIESHENQIMRIYPNPVNDYLFVNLNADIYTTVELIDVQGRLALSENISSKDFQLNVSKLNPGVYFIKVYGANQTAHQIFIKK
jgi:hypothetical protein